MTKNKSQGIVTTIIVNQEKLDFIKDKLRVSSRSEVVRLLVEGAERFLAEREKDEQLESLKSERERLKLELKKMDEKILTYMLEHRLQPILNDAEKELMESEEQKTARDQLIENYVKWLHEDLNWKTIFEIDGCVSKEESTREFLSREKLDLELLGFKAIKEAEKWLGEAAQERFKEIKWKD